SDNQAVAGLHTACSDGPGKPAKVQVRPVDPLDRKAKWLRLQIVLNAQAFQMLDQRRPVEPTHVLRTLGNVVAEPGGQRDRRDRSKVERLCEREVVRDDVMEALSRILDQVDLVDRQHDVTDPEERADIAVAASLRKDTLTGVYQNDGGIGVGRAGSH